MTNKYKILPILLITAVAVVFAGCGGTTTRLSVDEQTAFEDYVMSSYFIQRGDEALAESRAAWDYTVDVTLPTGATPTTAVSVNYPEKGQKTTATIETTGTANVYLVSNLTEYPNRDSILKTEENYYILDDGDGIYNTADVICDSAGTPDAKARVKFTTTFADGTIREEKIEETLSGTGYAEFDISGELSFPAPAADGTWTPPEGAAGWSSMVIYEQVEGNNYNLWDSYKNIMGVRYYTEQGSGSSLVRTSVSYERMVVRDAEGLSAMDNLAAFNSRLFSDDPDSNAVYTGETLTETVIRTKLSGNKKKQIETSSTVFDSTGGTVVTFTASYETADDGTVISAGEPVVTY